MARARTSFGSRLPAFDPFTAPERPPAPFLPRSSLFQSRDPRAGWLACRPRLPPSCSHTDSRRDASCRTLLPAVKGSAACRNSRALFARDCRRAGDNLNRSTSASATRSVQATGLTANTVGSGRRCHHAVVPRAETAVGASGSVDVGRGAARRRVIVPGVTIRAGAPVGANPPARTGAPSVRTSAPSTSERGRRGRYEQDATPAAGTCGARIRSGRPR